MLASLLAAGYAFGGMETDYLKYDSEGRHYYDDREPQKQKPRSRLDRACSRVLVFLVFVWVLVLLSIQSGLVVADVFGLPVPEWLHP